MGDLFGGDETTTTTSSQVVDLPSWVLNPMQGVVSRADALSREGFKGYNDPRYAGFSNDEQAAFQLTRDLTGQNGFNVDPSKQISAEVARRGLEGFSSSELQPFMNPYIENVLDINRRRQFENFDRNQNDYRQRASQAGAFGGSRFGLGEAEMNSNFQQQMADFDQQGLYDSFNQGYGRATAGTQMAGQTSMDLANLEGAGQQGGLADAQALMGIGGMQRGFNQQNLDFNYEEFMRQQAHPYQQLQFASGIINPAAQINAGTTQTDTQETEGGSGWLGTAVGLGAMAFGMPPTAAMGLGSMVGGSSSSAGNQMMSGLGSMMGGGSSIGNTFNTALNSTGRSNPGFAGPYQTPNMYGRYNEGGLVTASKHYNDGGLINGIREYATSGPDETLNPESGMTLFDLQNLWANDKFGNSSGDAKAPSPQQQPQQRQTNSAVSEPYLNTLAFIESSNNPNAVNADSGASGLFQFIPSTAKAYGLKDPTNVQEATKAVSKFTEDNRKVLLKNLKREPSMAELYLAHQQGATGSSKLLKNPKEKAYKVVGAKEVKLNLPEELRDNYKDITAQQFANLWLSKFDNEYQRLSKGYNKGGVVSPFRQDLQSYIVNPFNNLTDDISGKALDMTQGLSRGLQYFSGDQSPTRTDQFVDNARLGIAEDQLLRGEAPTNLRKMMSQVSPLARAGATEVSLDPLNNQLMVDAFEAPGTTANMPPQQKLLDQVTKVSPPKPGRKPVQEAPQQEQQQQQVQQQQQQRPSPNLPMIAFGAQLLASRNGFKRALGEAAMVGVNTKQEVDSRTQQALKEQAQMSLQRRNSDIQALRVNAEMERLNKTDPYKDILQELELQKKLKDLSGEKDLQKAINEMAKTLMETNPTYSRDPNKALADASKAVMSSRIGGNLQQGANIAPAQPVRAEDYFKQ